MYAECFRGQGFCTLQAENAADAYRLASELNPDIVVTDLRLIGRIDGLELTRRLKGATATASVPVIVLSASELQQDRAAATSAGCDLFLPKPCLPDELARAVASVLVTSHESRVDTMSNAHGAS